MRIVLDMQGAQTESRFRGIGRYTMNFALGVIRNRGPHEVILALSGLFPETIEPIREAFHGILPQENIRVWNAQGSVREMRRGDDMRREVAELEREAFLASLLPDIVHICSLFEDPADNSVASIQCFDKSTPVTVSFYDLIPFLNPEYFAGNAEYEKYYRKRLRTLGRAAALLAISAYAKQEAVEHLGLGANRIFNVSTAIDSKKFAPRVVDAQAAALLRKRFNLKGEFVLYTGGSDDRKNLPRLIRAYAALPEDLRTRHQLLLAGRILPQDSDRLHAVAKEAGLPKDILQFTGYISDDDLVQLFNLCQLFVFPSWHEGFGLPILEAMACGAPSIGSNTSSLPEVIGITDAMFDPFDVESIAAKITEVLRDGAMRLRLSQHGLRQAQKFSWDETARRAIAVWEGVASCQKPKWSERSFRYDWLIQEIAQRVGSANIDSLSAIAESLALNQQTGLERQLLIDVSDVSEPIPGLRELLLSPPGSFRVEPIYATAEHGYRYARKHVKQWFGLLVPGESDTVLQWQRGDVLLCPNDRDATGVRQSLQRQLQLDGVTLMPLTTFADVVDSLPVKRQLLIDVSELVQRDSKSGIQRVVRSILNEWLTNAPDGFRVEPIYASVTSQGYRYARKFTSSFMGLDVAYGALVDEVVDIAPGDIFIGLDLQLEVVTAHRDYYQKLRRQGVQVKFVLYDLLCIQLPQYFSQAWSKNFAKWLEVVIETDGVICISKSVADGLGQWMSRQGTTRKRPFSIEWFHLGADIENTIASCGMPQNANSVLDQLCQRTSFLMVGTLEPRKGHAQVLDAFNRLWSLGVSANLVIVGKRGWEVDELVSQLSTHAEKNTRLFWLTDASDEFLTKIYEASDCLIAASYGEGFGLPLIEAAQHKKPIIARDIPVFREVAQNFAFYFSGKAPEELADSIEEWLRLHEQGLAPTSEKMPWLTWKQSTALLMKKLFPER